MRQARAPDTGPSRNLSPQEPRALCRASASQPQTSAPHPLPPFPPFYFSHLLFGPHLRLPGRRRGPCGCQASPLGAFQVFLAPTPTPAPAFMVLGSVDLQG